ncbi:MAG TPA: DUF4276 family protein [Fluviicoccus sp.]|nr:DUF4276 family protein [Fluviicoccus sp.]
MEGDGEVDALPVLLRRLMAWRPPLSYGEVAPPIRVQKDRFLNRETEFQRFLQLAAGKCGNDGWLLILLDADDDCPASKGKEILERATGVIPHRRIAVVLANREFEAWYLAAARSLDGIRGFALDHLPDDFDAERPRDAKGWLAGRMASGRYRETSDQAGFAAVFDLAQAFAGSRSFRKLCKEWDIHMGHEPEAAATAPDS